MSKKVEILQAATRLIAAKGYKDASMAELAKITKVAQGTIFYHYVNKEQLFLSILEAFKDEILNEFSQYQMDHHFKSSQVMVEEVITFYFQLVGKMEDRFILLHRQDAYELASGNPACRRCLEAIYHCLFDIFELAIANGQRAGIIRSGSARKMAMILFTMVDGLVRFNTYNIYNAGALYDELIQSCWAILRNPGHLPNQANLLKRAN